MANHRKYVTVTERQMLYFASFLFAAVELSLTSYRIHSTNERSNTYDPIVAELLATSILTLISVPLILQFLQDADEGSAGNTSTTHHKQRQRKSTLASFFLHRWTVGFLSLSMWIMWLVGAAIATQHWPTRGSAGPGEQGRILTAIVALAWLAFVMVTFARHLVIIERLIRKVVVIDNGGRRTPAREGKPSSNGASVPASATAPIGVATRVPTSPASTASLASTASVPPPSGSRVATASSSSTLPDPAVPPAPTSDANAPSINTPAAPTTAASAAVADNANPAKASPSPGSAA